MGAGGKKVKRSKEPEIPEQTSFLWYVASLAGLAGVGMIVAAICMPYWHVSEGVEYRYMFRSKEKFQSYNETNYGLYSIQFDGGRTSLSWPQRVSTSSSAITSAVQMGQQQTTNAQYQAWAAQCPAACQDALTTRLACYKRISNISTLFLGGLAIAAVLVLVGIGWFFIFGKFSLLMIGCWFLAGLICFGLGGYWVWETSTCWNMIILSQQFPLPRLSTCWYMCLVGSGLYIAAAGIGVLAEIFDRASERRLKEIQRQQLLMEGTGADAFAPGIPNPAMMGPPPGMAMGMSPPGMGMSPPGMAMGMPPPGMAMGMSPPPLARPVGPGVPMGRGMPPMGVSSVPGPSRPGMMGMGRAPPGMR